MHPTWATTSSTAALEKPAFISAPGLSDYTVSLAAEFEDAFRGIRYRQRGLAPSATSGPFDIGRQVADAVAVLDAAGAEGAYVVGHSWGGHLAMHLAVRHPGRLPGLVLADPLGTVPDGEAGDQERILAAWIPPERATRAYERAMAGHGTAEDALESLAIVWPGYFSKPGQAPLMPPLSLSVDCYARTFESILWHFEHQTLEGCCLRCRCRPHWCWARTAPSRPSTAWPPPR